MRVLILAVLFVGGCSHVGLSAGGARVRIISGEDAQGCTNLGYLAAEAGANFQDFAHNLAQCSVDLRNQAGALGANALVLDPPQRGERMHSGWTTFIPKDSNDGCNNCVSQSGQAYSCSVDE